MKIAEMAFLILVKCQLTVKENWAERLFWNREIEGHENEKVKKGSALDKGHFLPYQSIQWKRLTAVPLIPNVK
jgi:hypothetical protein